ncbi:hypothetical protein OHR68_01555 [Spirillospora sp. NBC_00431]
MAALAALVRGLGGRARAVQGGLTGAEIPGMAALTAGWRSPGGEQERGPFAVLTV